MRKTLRILAIGALGLTGLPGQAAQEPSSTAPRSPPDVQIIDLARAAADIAREHADRSDVSQTFYLSTESTVHMHVLGYERKVAMHVHRTTEEATVIVSGAPRVSLAVSRHGKRKTSELAARPGVLIFSPPSTGHEWFNPDPRGMQANLVFASPPFDGNTYLDASDLRVLKSGEPFIFNPDDALRSFLASGAPFRIEPVPMRRERMVIILVRSDAIIPAHPTSPTLLYVTTGKGILLVGDAYPLRQQLLVNVPPNRGIKVRAEPGTPLVMIAFRPEA